MNTNVGFEMAKELLSAGFPCGMMGGIIVPTALEIIEQMPFGTYPCKNADGLWYVWFELPGYQRDFRHDACPHIAAALAFIAWKQGLD